MTSKEKVPKNVRRGTLTSKSAKEEKCMICWRPDNLTERVQVAAITKKEQNISAKRIKR